MNTSFFYFRVCDDISEKMHYIACPAPLCKNQHNLLYLNFAFNTLF